MDKQKTTLVLYIKKLGTVNKVVLILNLIAALLLLLSYLSPIVSPQKNFIIAFLGLGYPLLLLINLFFFVYWAVKQKKLIWVSALSLVVGCNLFFHNVNFSVAGAKRDSTVRIMAYNVHNFNGLDTPINLPRHTEILKLIKTSQPDILTIEEFNLQNARFKIIDSLKAALGTPYYYFEPFVKTEFDSTGLAIFSKFPITNKGIIDLSGDNIQNSGIYVDVRTPKKTIRVYCVHLESLNFNNDEYQQISKYHVPTYAAIKSMTIKLKQGFIDRSAQADILKSAVVKCNLPYIIAGDLNDTPNSYAVRSISKGIKNTFREKGNGLGATFSSAMPLLQIDHIIVSTDFRVNDHKVINEVISDHNPIYVDLYLK